MLRMEIALFLILMLVGYMYFSAERIQSALHQTFSLLLIVLQIHLLFDAATVYTVNHLDTVPPLLNAQLHRAFIGSMVLVLLAGDGFSFLLFWEIMAVASFLLVNHESHLKSTWTAAYQYLVMTSLGTTALMIAFLMVGAHSKSYSFVDMAANSLTPELQNWVFVAAFLGFALKAGLVPLHVWLPQAHPAAPSHVSALMSGVMLKIALYGFGRFVFGLQLIQHPSFGCYRR